MNPQTETKMVADPKRAKMVKIKAISAIVYENKKEDLSIHLKEGDVAEVPEHVAAEYCDRQFIGSFAFSGERDIQDSARHKAVRAVRL